MHDGVEHLRLDSGSMLALMSGRMISSSGGLAVWHPTSKMTAMSETVVSSTKRIPGAQ
jgi:hypothetical protein